MIYALGRTRPRAFAFPGVTMRPEPVSRAEAARRLHKAAGTIASYASRYGVPRWRTDAGVMYDFSDLSLIEWFTRTGRTVPKTPRERADEHQRHLARL